MLWCRCSATHMGGGVWRHTEVMGPRPHLRLKCSSRGWGCGTVRGAPTQSDAVCVSSVPSVCLQCRTWTPHVKFNHSCMEHSPKTVKYHRGNHSHVAVNHSQAWPMVCPSGDSGLSQSECLNWVSKTLTVGGEKWSKSKNKKQKKKF